jgi:hypothetical protein
MKSVMYHYNGFEGVEELHEDDEVAKLARGNVIERKGEYWRIIDIQMHIAVSAERPLDLIKVYLEGPLRFVTNG